MFAPSRRHARRPWRRASHLAVLVLAGCVTQVGVVQARAGRTTSARPPAVATAIDTAARLADALLAADRAFAAASDSSELALGLTRMFAADVLMPYLGGIVRGAREAEAALRAAPANAGARSAWTPIRAGVSADGTHGFTIGYLTVTRADGSALPMKYVAYWIRQGDGWRVAAYKRTGRAAGAVDTAVRPPSLPTRLVAAPAADSAAVEGYAAELRATELAFSADGALGLGPAFFRYAAPDAYHTGGPGDAAFLHGPEDIARAIGQALPGPSAISWAPEVTLVASSGDLGVNVGYIDLPPNPRTPFLSIWRRSGPGAPWRYVAE